MGWGDKNTVLTCSNDPYIILSIILRMCAKKSRNINYKIKQHSRLPDIGCQIMCAYQIDAFLQIIVYNNKVQRIFTMTGLVNKSEYWKTFLCDTRAVESVRYLLPRCSDRTS